MKNQNLVYTDYSITEGYLHNPYQQSFLSTSPPHKLKRLIERRSLTEALEYLENFGFFGDTAIFALSLGGVK